MAVAAKTTARIRQDAFRHVVHMPLSRVVERGPSEFVARIVRDAAEFQRGLLALTSKAVTQVTKGMAGVLVALVVEPRLTLVGLVVIPMLGFVLGKLGKRIRRGTRGALKAQEGLLRIATEIVQGLRAVKGNTGERAALRRFHGENRTVLQQELRVRTARAVSGPISEVLAIMILGVLALIAAKQIIDGNLDPQRFGLAIGALVVAGASFKPLAGLINEMQAASAPAARLMEILDEAREVRPGARRALLPRHRQSIEFENVSYTYPAGERPALEDVSLRVMHGERVAIVGPNGSGKTTLLSLVPRLLRPQNGRVLIDGIDIESVSLRGLRRQIGVVTQETVLFRGTIAENIAFGVSGVTRQQVIDAAKRAHADHFIDRLPGGYDANLAEQGASLSGGQRQRLAIARAILRDPSILILDEATSQIDAESEEHINEALSEFCRGRTSLLIAHRLSTVLNADRIVVMDSGAIVDQGTHHQLMDRCAVYRRLSKTQLFVGGE
jgi:ABC-type multidrug transport system fused ATPase/permease subunit